jgi:hypothetical protein
MSGTNMYYNSGKVLVGNVPQTIPNYDLQVYGNTYISGIITYKNQLTFTDQSITFTEVVGNMFLMTSKSVGSNNTVYLSLNVININGATLSNVSIQQDYISPLSITGTDLSNSAGGNIHVTNFPVGFTHSCNIIKLL